MNDFDDVEILLVEDNRQDAEMTIRALKKHVQNKLFWAKDGVEALDFIHCTGAFAGRDARQIPKLILLDLKMPRIDGLGVLNVLKADIATSGIPVVAMTSSNQERDVAESYRLGVNGYVTKPIGYDELVTTLTRIGDFWLLENRAP